MYPIEIRAQGDNGTTIDFPTAVTLAMGGSNRISIISVTAVDPAQDGKPVWGIDAEIHPRGTRYDKDKDATVSISGAANHSPEMGMLRAQCYLLAIQVAAAANAAAAASSAATEEN